MQSDARWPVRTCGGCARARCGASTTRLPAAGGRVGHGRGRVPAAGRGLRRHHSGRVPRVGRLGGRHRRGGVPVGARLGGVGVDPLLGAEGGHGGGHRGLVPLLDGRCGGIGGGLAKRSGLLLLALDLLRIAVEEEVDHHLPLGRARDGGAEAQHLTREHPVHQANRLLALVVRRDCDVDVLARRVRVAEGDHGDVHVRSLGDRLVVGERVGDDQEARLHELLGDLVGEHTRRVAAGDGRGAGVLRVLEDGALAVGAGGDDAHVSRVLDTDDDARGKQQLLVGLAQVDDVDAVGLPLPDVAVHLEVQVLGAEVRRARKHHLEVALLLLLTDVGHGRHGCWSGAQLRATDYKWSAKLRRRR
mmetsp:Transcript_40258/g.99498  ORF Transcript_40258/g.99498 Transcript_40258/m.99498 type:complete len:360 (+) Transcript_40258:317-1396(+)